MTERYEHFRLWAYAVLIPSPVTSIALMVMFGLWGWGIRWVMVPQWQLLRRQAQQLIEQQGHEHHVFTTLRQIPVAGRLIAVTEEPLHRLCQQQAIEEALDVVSSQRLSRERVITMSLRGKRKRLLDWWNVIGRSSLLGSVSHWQLQLIEHDDKEEAALYEAQLDIELHPEPWQWEALSSS